MHAPEASLFNSLLIVCAAVGCIIVFFILSMAHQHRKNIAMYKSQLSVEISTLERERARIAADLHDEIGPMLSTIKMRIATLDVEPGDIAIRDAAEQNCNDVILKLRNISNNLLPAVLLREGLVPALQKFIDEVGCQSQTKIFLTSGVVPKLPSEVCVNVFRIGQEIVHNALKHSGATELNIHLTGTEKKIILTARDNGKGFDHLKASRERSGLGLRNIWSRTELLNGDLFLDSKPGKGTHYSIEIPLQTN